MKALPAVAVAGAETVKCVAGAVDTTMLAEVPVIADVTESVAVTVWLPAVFRVTEKVPTPLVSVEFAGRVALPSVVVKWTVPV